MHACTVISCYVPRIFIDLQLCTSHLHRIMQLGSTMIRQIVPAVPSKLVVLVERDKIIFGVNL